MNFGCSVNPMFFCYLVNIILRPLTSKIRLRHYFDDICVLANTFDELIDSLDQVIDCLKSAGFLLSLNKMQIGYEEIRFLGYIIRHNTLQLDSKRIEALKNLATPSSVAGLRRLLGLTNTLQRFIPNYAQLTLPLTRMLKKNSRVKWTPECQRILQQLIEHLTTHPILQNFDYTKPILIESDASANAYGFALL